MAGERRARRPRSLRMELVLVFATLTVVTATVLGLLAYQAIRRTVEASTALTAATVAHGRGQTMLRILGRRQARVAAFLNALPETCPPGAERCVREALDLLRTTEQAVGALLLRPGQAPVSVGVVGEVPEPWPLERRDQIAWTSAERPAEPRLFVPVVQDAGSLLLVHDVARLRWIFSDPSGVGVTGEVFLVDGAGRPLSPLRYAGADGGALDSASVRACRAGRERVRLAPDYSGRDVIGAYQQVPEIGGGCVVAHLGAAEAFAPARLLLSTTAGVMALFAAIAIVLSFVVARVISRPIERLTGRARAMQVGEFDGAIPAEGPLEIRTLAETFDRMARSIRASRAELLAGEQRLRVILESALDAVVGMDERGCIVAWNAQAERLFGWRRERVLGKRMVDFIVPERERAGYEEARERFLATGEAPFMNQRVELLARRADGSEFPAQAAITAVEVGGSTVFNAFISDITERKRSDEERARLLSLEQAARGSAEALAAELRDALRARDEFLSIASHELRTPLTPLKLQMQSITRMLRKGQTSALAVERLLRMFEIADRQIERLARLVRDLLDVSRIGAGRLAFELDDVDLTELVRDVLERFGEEAENMGCALSFHAPGPVLGRWDRFRLEQVVANLVTNSIKYGRGRPIEITVSGSDETAYLVVSDRGLGIDPEHQERIFERYERAVSSREYGGLGLGLYIVRQIVEGHGGQVRVESALGEGATFIVELPRRAAAEKGASVGKEAAA